MQNPHRAQRFQAVAEHRVPSLEKGTEILRTGNQQREEREKESELWGFVEGSTTSPPEHRLTMPRRNLPRPEKEPSGKER